MAGSLQDFIAKVKANKALKHKVFYAEAEAANALETLKKIAADEGFVISAKPPSATAAKPTAAELEGSCGVVMDTCCWVFTSTLIAEEA